MKAQKSGIFLLHSTRIISLNITFNSRATLSLRVNNFHFFCFKTFLLSRKNFFVKIINVSIKFIVHWWAFSPVSGGSLWALFSRSCRPYRSRRPGGWSPRNLSDQMRRSPESVRRKEREKLSRKNEKSHQQLWQLTFFTSSNKSLRKPRNSSFSIVSLWSYVDSSIVGINRFFSSSATIISVRQKISNRRQVNNGEKIERERKVRAWNKDVKLLRKLNHWNKRLRKHFFPFHACHLQRCAVVAV